MSKFTIRKVLGLGAVVALATTLFAGAPAANASVAPITLTENGSYGTYTTLLNSGFFLKSWVTPSALSGHRLIYKIENVGTTSVNGGWATDHDNWDHSNYSDFYYLNAGTSFWIYAQDYGYNNVQNDLFLSAQTYDQTGVVKLKVTAYLDNGNEVFDGNEESASQTLTFVHPSSTTATTTIKDATYNDTGITAAVTYANKDINLEQVATTDNWGWSYEDWYCDDDCVGVTGVWLTRNGTANTHFVGYDDWCSSWGCWSTNGDISYNSDDKTIEYYWNYGGLDAGVYTAQAYYWNDEITNAGDDKWIAWGKTAQAVVATPTVSTIDRPVATANANTVSNDSGSWNYVRTGTTSVTYTTTLKKSNGDPVAAGIKANVYLSDYGLINGSTITAGGKTLTTNGSDISVPVVTDANGKVSLTITATGQVNDEIELWVESQGQSSSSTYTQWQDTEEIVYANTGEDRSIAVGGSTVVNYVIQDQFNQPASGTYQLDVYRHNSSVRESKASYRYTVPVSNGAASVTVKDNGTGFGYEDVCADLYKQQTGGGWEYDNSGTGTDCFKLTYTDASLVTPTSISLNLYHDNNGVTKTVTDPADTKVQPVALTDLSKFVPWNDSKYYGYIFDNHQDRNLYANTTETTASDGYLEVYGNVSSANGDAAGVPVTISLPGAALIDWKEAGDYTAAKSTLTVITDSSGYYDFGVYTNVSGKQTITITSGSVNKTVDVTFAAAAPASVGLSVAGGAASAQSGRSVDVSATVKDANGNAIPGVDVTFAAVGGSGSLSASTATTDAKGVASVRYVTSVADTGSVDFTATAGDITSAKSTVTFVRSAGNVTHSKKNVVTAHWTNAKGQAVLVTVDGYRRYNQVELSDAANFFSKKLKKGRHVINLYIGGVLVDSLKWTVKK